MKKRFALLVFVTVILYCFGYSQNTHLSNSEIPNKITGYVKENFPQRIIIQAIKDSDDLSYKYNVTLDDYTKLEFNKKEEIIEIESKNKSKLPDSVIPKRILFYVQTQFSGNHIISWELDDNKQKVELNNNVDLEFDRDGNFIKID